jgi:hypothetical protein
MVDQEEVDEKTAIKQAFESPTRKRHPVPEDWIVYLDTYTYIWDPWTNRYRVYLRGVGVINDRIIRFKGDDEGSMIPKRESDEENHESFDLSNAARFAYVINDMKEGDTTLMKLMVLATKVKSGVMTVEEAVNIKRSEIQLNDISNWDMA